MVLTIFIKGLSGTFKYSLSTTSSGISSSSLTRFLSKAFLPEPAENTLAGDQCGADRILLSAKDSARIHVY